MIAERQPQQDTSYTRPADHSTAAAIGKQYCHEFPPSANPDKRSTRGDDGEVSSGQFIRFARPGEDAVTHRALRIEYHHPIEKYLRHPAFRRLLGLLAKEDANGVAAIEKIIASYRNPAWPLWERIKYWIFHKFIDRMRGQTPAEVFRQRMASHKPTVRGLVIVARSLAEFGPQIPQRFSAPLFAVWNFTNRCNLACKHCYQDSERRTIANELTLEEKFRLVDQMGQAHLPMLALSGGEPTISPDLLPLIRRAKGHGMHLTIATNGTNLTPDFAGRLAEAGLRYVEISLDSVDPARHDAFRGTPGMWEKAVAGAKAVVATPGLRLGIAMCVHQGNFHEVSDMIRFAERLGAGCFAHFNFIPVGRGLKMVSGDITPRQREELLAILNAKMQEGGMGVISTAPQLGRVCLAGAVAFGPDGLIPLGRPDEKAGRVACSHAGAGSGVKARAVAKYLGGCGAGRTYVCIEPNGDVTPCVYLPHRVMGNVRQKSFIDIFRDSVFWQILNDRNHRLHHCEVCAMRIYCGGCRARADAYYGQLHAGDPGCIFNSKHWDELVRSGVAVIADAQQSAAEMHITATRHGPG
ncbi:MAG: radical SAM protein [Planctomycetes bacterium]|nr:radical SAM protein [Planctomycetota bacterium]